MSVDASFQANSSSVAEAIVMQPCSPFLNKGRNVTADIWFSSLLLVERLRELKTVPMWASLEQTDETYHQLAW